METVNGIYTVDEKDPSTGKVITREVHLRTNVGQIIGLSDNFKSNEAFSLTRNSLGQITKVTTDSQTIDISYDSKDRLYRIIDSASSDILQANYDVRGRFIGLSVVTDE